MHPFASFLAAVDVAHGRPDSAAAEAQAMRSRPDALPLPEPQPTRRGALVPRVLVALRRLRTGDAGA